MAPNLDVAKIMAIIKEKDEPVIKRMRKREEHFSKRVAFVEDVKKHTFPMFERMVTKVEEVSDELLTCLAEFLKGRPLRSNVNKLEEQLQEIIIDYKIFEQGLSSVIVASEINTLNENKENYARVLSKVESLQTLARNAMDDKTTSTPSPESRRRKYEHNAPLLSSNLNLITSALTALLKMASIILVASENYQKEVDAFTLTNQAMEKIDLQLMGTYRREIYGYLNDMERSIYERSNLRIDRPGVVRNGLMTLTSLNDVDESFKSIKRRLERIARVCQGHIDDLNHIVYYLQDQIDRRFD